MNKKIGLILLMVILVITMVGCTQAERVSYNLSKEADSFNVVRQLTVINCIGGDVMFQMTGKMSIQPDPDENQLEVIVETEKGYYEKHFVGLSDNVSYTVQQLKVKNVSEYKYTLNFNPKMWIPIDAKNID